MWKNLSIGKKLISAFVVIALLASISGLASVGILSRIDANYSDALVNYGFAQGDIGKALSAFCEFDGYVHDAVSYLDEQNQDAAQDYITKNTPVIPQYLATVETTIISQEARQLYENVSKGWTSYLEKANELTAAASTSDSKIVAEVQKRIVAELDPLYDQVYSALKALLDRKVSDGDSLSGQLTNFAKASLLAVVLLTVAVLAVSIVLGILVARIISNPVKACSERLRKLADGDLSSDVPKADSRDELGLLAQATDTIVLGLQGIVSDITRMLDAMGGGDFSVQSAAKEHYVGDFTPILRAMEQINNRLSDTMDKINRAAQQVSGGADQVSGGAQALSQGATEQASSVQELAATIAEISEQVRSNAGNAMQASEQADRVGKEMETGNGKMQDMIRAMQDISESSSEIGKIIKTIEDIAFQTNILALNAAVEAARAGAAGKGFSVVADEVRNLASKSAEASKNTAALIERSIHAVENGTRIADETGKALTEAVEGAGEMAKTIGRISEASGRQADSIGQVTVGIDQISSVVQTNSATAEESAAASEELSSQAQILKNLVAQFRLRETATLKLP